MQISRRLYLLVFLVSVLTSLGSIRAEERRPEELHRIAFGSCASQNKPQPIWDAIVAQRPDLFLFLGDNIYADTVDMAVMKAKYAKLAGKAGYQTLLDTCPVLATWDDHDYGVNDGGAAYPMKKESQQIMLDFFGVPAESPRRKREGIYGSFIFGPEGRRVQVILLDARYFKSPQKSDARSKEEKKKRNLVGWYVANNDPSTTVLGDAQWKWLETQLREPAEIRVIASSMQVIADEKGMESWGNFPHERARLYELIDKTKAQGVLFVSGDVHFSEISKTDDGPYPLYDFTSSGLTNSAPEWAAAVNSYRVSDIAYAEPTFGLIEIDWDAPSPTIGLRAIGVRGNIAFEESIALDTLKKRAGD